MTDSLHTVTVEFDTIGIPSLRFNCAGDASSPCHKWCPREECAEGCTAPGKHELTADDECMVAVWLEDGDASIDILGGSTSFTAPIETEWHGEGYDWRFSS